MKAKRLCAVVLALVTFVSACGEDVAGSVEGSGEPPLARSIFDALKNGDEEKFVELYIMKGDQTTDRLNDLTTQAGGRMPDDAWDAEVRRKFINASNAFERLGEDVAYKGVVEVDKYDWTKSDYLDRMKPMKGLYVGVTADGIDHVICIGYSVMSHRGRVITGGKSISIIHRAQYDGNRK